MTSDPNPEGYSYTDPIRNVFLESELTDMLEPPVKDPVDPFTDAVNRGLVSPELIEAREIFLLLSPEERIRICREAVDDLQRKADDERNTMGDTLLSKYLELRFKHMVEGDPSEDFVPLKYFKDVESNPSGMTPEEWAALPQSTKDTLRELKFD